MRAAKCLLFGLGLLAADISLPADPAGNSAEIVVMRHMNAFNAGLVDETVADYADSATVITAGGITTGKPQIRQLFSRILGGAPNTRPMLDLKTKFFTAEFGYIVWQQNAGTPNEIQGADSFVVRDGKIVAQTVAAVRLHPQAVPTSK